MRFLVALSHFPLVFTTATACLVTGIAFIYQDLHPSLALLWYCGDCGHDTIEQSPFRPISQVFLRSPRWMVRTTW